MTYLLILAPLFFGVAYKRIVHEATNAQVILTKIAEAKEYRETLALQKEIVLALN